MRTGRPVAVATVTSEQRLELETWSRRPKTAQALAQLRLSWPIIG
ncbi:MAG: hypothetical protein ABSD67_23490 [Terracidiphilus sp.]|jgi:hypothetical protein